MKFVLPIFACFVAYMIAECAGDHHLPAECLEPPSETGVCLALFNRFHFKESENACKPFVYGGCGGTANNFRTKEECESLCIVAEEDGGDHSHD